MTRAKRPSTEPTTRGPGNLFPFWNRRETREAITKSAEQSGPEQSDPVTFELVRTKIQEGIRAAVQGK